MGKAEVRESKIQGKGVYATQNINEGEVVLEIDDSHVVRNPSKLTAYQNEYECDYLADGKIVLMQVPEKFINHSCNPTTYVKTINGTRKVLAIRDIKKGEEITYDYSINGYNEGSFNCYCGSENCRGVYQGNFFKLPKKLQIKYLPYLDDWFIKEHKDEIDRLKER
jgi:SET domain-containing protein